MSHIAINRCEGLSYLPVPLTSLSRCRCCRTLVRSHDATQAGISLLSTVLAPRVWQRLVYMVSVTNDFNINRSEQR